MRSPVRGPGAGETEDNTEAAELEVMEEDEAGGAANSQQSGARKRTAAKYPCIICKQNVSKNAVRCNTCQLWVHVPCGNISKELFAILSNKGKFGSVCWNCDSCAAASARLEARMVQIESRCTEVENRMLRTEAATSKVDARMDQVEKKQEDANKKLEGLKDQCRREMIQEMRES